MMFWGGRFRGVGRGDAQGSLRIHLHLFARVELEQLFGLLREWMLAQITFQDKDFDQLICDGKTLRGSAAQPDGATSYGLRPTA